MSNNDQWWGSLSPAEQEGLMSQYMTGITGPSAMDYGSDFEDTGFNFGMDMGGGGMMPMNAMGVAPSVSDFQIKGKTNYQDLAEEAKRVNLLQDYGSLSVDNILTGYGGGGSYDIDAFTPTYEYGEPLNLKGRRKAEMLSKTGGWQGFVTDLILENGMSPAEAEAELYKTVSAPDDDSLSDQDRALKASLIESLPPSRADQGPISPSMSRNRTEAGKTRDPYDSEAISQFTTRVWSDLLEDPEFAYQDPKTGLYYGKTPEEAEVKTPQMLAYDKFGLPYPTATYEDPEYIDAMTRVNSGGLGTEEVAAAGQEFDVGRNDLNAQIDDLKRQRQVAGQDATRLQSAWDAYQTAPTEPQRTGPADNPFNLPEMSLENARKAADIDFDVLLGDEGKAITAGQPREGLYRQQAYNRAGLGPKPEGLMTSQGAKERGWKTEAADKAAQIDYDLATEKWTNEQKQRLYDEAMFRAAKNQMPGAPYVVTNKAGDIVVKDFKDDKERAAFDFGVRSEDFLGPIAGGGERAGKRTQSRRITERDIGTQRQRVRDVAMRNNDLANQRVERNKRDPRLSSLAAMAAAYYMNRGGQTPFQDAMASRNANSAAMLRGY